MDRVKEKDRKTDLTKGYERFSRKAPNNVKLSRECHEGTEGE